MEGFFSLKTLLRLAAAAIVLAALIVLISERIENTRPLDVIAQREVTRIVEQTVIVTQIVDRIVTATPMQLDPSDTSAQPVSTSTPQATGTPETLAVLPDGFSIWCLPKGSKPDENLIPVTGQAPENAYFAEKSGDTLTVTTQMQSCTFVATFNQPLPEGVRLQVKDLNPTPFIDEELLVSAENRSMGYITLDHYFIVDPPYWEVTYQVVLLSIEGESLWEKPVLFKRGWQPAPCPNGLMPNPYTLECDTQPSD